jgi:hypothetical protein
MQPEAAPAYLVRNLQGGQQRAPDPAGTCVCDVEARCSGKHASIYALIALFYFMRCTQLSYSLTEGAKKLNHGLSSHSGFACLSRLGQTRFCPLGLNNSSPTKSNTKPNNENLAITCVASSCDEQKSQESKVHGCCRWIAADHALLPDSLHHLTRLLNVSRCLQIIR